MPKINSQNKIYSYNKTNDYSKYLKKRPDFITDEDYIDYLLNFIPEFTSKKLLNKCTIVYLSDIIIQISKVNPIYTVKLFGNFNIDKRSNILTYIRDNYNNTKYKILINYLRCKFINSEYEVTDWPVIECENK